MGTFESNARLNLMRYDMRHRRNKVIAGISNVIGLLNQPNVGMGDETRRQLLDELSAIEYAAKDMYNGVAELWLTAEKETERYYALREELEDKST